MRSHRWSSVMLCCALVGCVAVVSIAARQMWMPGPLHRGALPVATDAQVQRASRLERHVRFLAETVGERHMQRPEALEQTMAYIEDAWQEQGLSPRRECFEVSRVTPPQTVCNVVVTMGEGADGPLVVGAHYDTVPGTPGADDNGSGVAVLLEMTRELAKKTELKRTRVVAFVNEEPPYFRTPDMGSAHDAAQLAEAGEDVRLMISLDMLGFYSDTPGSQAYPVSWLTSVYGDVGNFISFVGGVDSTTEIRAATSEFRGAVAFPAHGSALPTSVPGIDFSDHLNYIARGWPSVMVTDTAFNRNPHYHQHTDMAEHLNYDAMARVTDGLVAVVEGL